MSIDLGVARTVSITNTVSQTLKKLYPIKITNDFYQYLKDEEYDSEVLTDDLKEDKPFFVEYIVSQNPSTFNDETREQQLVINVKKLLNTFNDDAMEHMYNAEPLDREYSMSPEEEEEASMDLIHHLTSCDELQQQQTENQIQTDEKYAQILANPPSSNTDVALLNDNEWKCKQCTFINEKSNDICSLCHSASLVCDEKWDCIYNELRHNYTKSEQYNSYYSIIVDILNKKEFEFDDAVVDLNGNDSIIAAGIIDTFGNDFNTTRLISCLKEALNEDKLYEVHYDAYEMNECTEWKSILAIIIGLRRNAKYRKKLAKYEAFANALSIFDDGELSCLLRLFLREKITKSSVEFDSGSDIFSFIKYRFPEKCKTLDLEQIFEIGFSHKLIGHNSILRKLNQEYQVFVDLKTIQIWMSAIVMKMNEYFIKYKSCNAIFCIRFLPQNSDEILLDKVSLSDAIKVAFNTLDENEKEMMTDYCWIFVIDLCDNNEVKISFESRELYDDEVITERKYNSIYSKNQLYHLKRLDYCVSKENDNSAMALQISFHKYCANNCVSWLTHSSGHIPFHESDIVQFIPKIFKTRTDPINNDEWKEIVNNAKMTEMKSMDRKYSELSQCYNNFLNDKSAK